MNNSVVPPVPEESFTFPNDGDQKPTNEPTSNSPTSSGGESVKPVRKTGRVIATIFGLLLLVGGVGAGLILVQQQQNIKEKAAGAGTCGGGPIVCTESGTPGNVSIACTTAQTEQECTGRNDVYFDTNKTCTGACAWNATAVPDCATGLSCSGTPITGSSQCTQPNLGTLTNCCPAGQIIQNGACVTSSGGGGGGDGGGLSGNICSGRCCSANTSNGFYVQRCTCSGPLVNGRCLENCTNAGGSACIPENFCGSQQLDVRNAAGEAGSGSGGIALAIAMNGNGQCSGGGGGGGACVSDYCAGPDQCFSQGGTTGAQGTRPSGGNCTTNTVMCCIGGGGGGGGGGPAPTPAPKVCGETCSADTDCYPTGANGSTVRCVSGVCQNTACIGKTTYGRNCDCSSLNACGQGCSASVGLCQTGSICRYVNGPSCTDNTNPNNPTSTYCVPTTLTSAGGWNTLNCVARDQGNSYVTLNGANPTVAQIQAECAGPLATAQCGGIKAYDTNWNLLNTSTLASLKAGSKVRFTIMGVTTSGSFDKARFTINGTQTPEVTTQKPGSAGEFYYEYTIPAGTTSFTVTGQIHQQQLNTWN